MNRDRCNVEYEVSNLDAGNLDQHHLRGMRNLRLGNTAESSYERAS